ncbi:MAG TPA: galactose oxidase-like domain-containing protein, partial [Acidimicrobiales bacterium]|nr:galactose oxidase-like domain-containing protein [Acidimicrobiales bacterium]
AGQSYDEALWNIAATYDPAAKSWHDLGVPGLLSPGVNPLFAGFRGSTFSAVLPLQPNANDTYTRASFLSAGGVILPSPGSYVAVADSRINTVTTNGGNDQLATTPTGSLGRGRWFSTAVPLPDGSVYAVSGADVDEVIAPGLESPILQSELFTPTLDSKGNYTGGSWQPAGQQDRRRTYHNTAILLPDGSVLIGGNAPIPFLDAQVLDGVSLPGRPGTNNHHDPSFQLYRPPYFGKTRPVITSIQSRPGALVIHTPQAATIASVVMMRNTAITHLVDGDAHSVVLPIQVRDTTTNPTDPTVTVQLPASSNVLPNGPYLLFANQNATNVKDAAPGHVVPSIGAQVFAEGTNTAATPTILVAPPAATYSTTVKAAANASTPASASLAGGSRASGAPAGAAAAHASVLARAAAGDKASSLGRDASLPTRSPRPADASRRVLLLAAAGGVLLMGVLVGVRGRGRRRWRQIA